MGNDRPPRKTRAELDELGFTTQAQYDAWYFDMQEQYRASYEAAGQELKAILRDPDRRARLMEILKEQEAKRAAKRQPK